MYGSTAELALSGPITIVALELPLALASSLQQISDSLQIILLVFLKVRPNFIVSSPNIRGRFRESNVRLRKRANTELYWSSTGFCKGSR